MEFNEQAMTMIQMLDDTSVGISLIDTKGNIIFANQKLLTKLEESAQAMVGKNANDLTRTNKTNVCLFHKTLKAKKEITENQIYTNENGEQFSINITQKPIFNTSGELEYIVGINKDITKLPSQTFTPKKFYEDEGVIWGDEKMHKILINLRNISPYPLNIMLIGETGVGKDVLARFIHQVGARSKGPYVAINCAALPENLIESELFGYERGAFTGALSHGKSGLLENANGGTLFLNEINSLPLAIQGKLLTALEEKRIRRIGNSRSIDVDFQIISAANQDLTECIHAKTFRSDLYYRLNTISIELPPLRERPDDVIALTEFFMKKFCTKYNKDITLSDQYMDFLLSYSWPGNVRELKHFIERLVVMTSQEETPILKDILVTGIPVDAQTKKRSAPKTVQGSLKKNMEEYEKTLIQQAITQNRTLRQAAAILDIPPSTLTRKMQKYGLTGE